MRTRNSLLILGTVMLASLTGCYSSPNIALHSPGVYKGPTDPLLAKERDPQHQKALLERFNLVQRDR
jgi:hypothetical protein